LQTKFNLKAQTAAQVAGGPAVKLPGDVKEGDLVTAIDGKEFTTFGELNEIVRTLSVGKPVVLSVIAADGAKATRRITLAERPRDPGDATYEVIYDHVLSSGNRIRTIVTRPKKPGKHPVMFWMQGIGTGSVDAPLTSPGIITRVLKPFSDEGWVTVRVEKPGVGDSEGGPAMKVAFNEENDIYRQTLKALDKYEFVDRDRVYAFGHSMGGCHAPIIASELPLKGIVTYGTVSDSWLEWQIKAARFQGLLSGAEPAEIDQRVRQTVAFYSALYNDKKTVPQIRKEHPELAEYIRVSIPSDDMLSARSVKYMQELNDKNFSDYWQRIGNAKVLALFGENDFVALEADQTQIPFLVNRKKPGNSVFMKVKESDHGFAKTTSMQDSLAKWGKPDAEFNPEIIRVMKEWIASVEAAK